jgi:hypothetical protein
MLRRGSGGESDEALEAEETVRGRWGTSGGLVDIIEQFQQTTNGLREAIVLTATMAIKTTQDTSGACSEEAII